MNLLAIEGIRSKPHLITPVELLDLTLGLPLFWYLVLSGVCVLFLQVFLQILRKRNRLRHQSKHERWAASGPTQNQFLPKQFVLQSSQPTKKKPSAASRFKGVQGEIMVRDELAMELPPDFYHVFHDILIPTPEGALTQVDHVVVSVFGVFVIETKHYSGWIYGQAEDRQWTFRFRDGKQESRQNPIWQNAGHIRALAHLVQEPELYFCNIVRLTGAAEIKTGAIYGVMQAGMPAYIKGFQNPLFSIEAVRKMYQKIMMADRSKCQEAKEEHLTFVQRRASRRKAA